MVESGTSVKESIPCLWVAYPLLFGARVKGGKKGTGEGGYWNGFTYLP